jgi:hypothetical protein
MVVCITSCTSHIVSCRASAVVRINLAAGNGKNKGTGQVHASQTATEDRNTVHLEFDYVNAAYCGANPVSQPNPPP